MTELSKSQIFDETLPQISFIKSPYCISPAYVIQDGGGETLLVRSPQDWEVTSIKRSQIVSSEQHQKYYSQGHKTQTVFEALGIQDVGIVYKW
jgi:hypothetical protein